MGSVWLIVLSVCVQLDINDALSGCTRLLLSRARLLAAEGVAEEESSRLAQLLVSKGQAMQRVRKHLISSCPFSAAFFPACANEHFFFFFLSVFFVLRPSLVSLG